MQNEQMPFAKELKPILDNLESYYPRVPASHSGPAPMWFFCSYWPEELSMAAGREPYRVLPASGVGNSVYLPTYCCSLARNVMETAEAMRKDPPGDIDSEDFFGFAHTCDTMQCLGQIWNHAVYGNSFRFVPPVSLGAEGALEFTVRELKQVAEKLGTAGGTAVEKAELRRAISLNNTVRSLVSKLDRLRPYYPSHFISGLVRAAQVTPRKMFTETLGAVLPVMEDRAGNSTARPGLLVSGALLENESLYRLIEELGARVLIDDTCTGSRHFSTLVDEESDPFEGLAARFLARPNCPCRHRDLNSRGDYLVELAGRKQVKGAVLVLRKYCDPHAWDIVSTGEKLRSCGIPVLVLELEGATPGGQERTRLQAFLESVQGGFSID